MKGRKEKREKIKKNKPGLLKMIVDGRGIYAAVVFLSSIAPV